VDTGSAAGTSRKPQALQQYSFMHNIFFCCGYSCFFRTQEKWTQEVLRVLQENHKHFRSISERTGVRLEVPPYLAMKVCAIEYFWYIVYVYI